MNPTPDFCKSCSLETNKLESPSLQCEICKQNVHIQCLRRKTPPGGIIGDVFFNFNCLQCSPEEEVFNRDKMTWFQTVVLVLYDLLHKAVGSGRNGYFHWKIHIVSYIDKHWHILFRKDFKRKKNWTGTVSGTLSLNSPVFFLSGTHVFGEGGWWKLQHPDLTPQVIVDLYNDLIVTKQQNKHKSRQQPGFVAPEDQTIVNELIENYGFLKVPNNKKPNDAMTNYVPTSTKRSKYESDENLLFDSHDDDGGFLDFLPGADDLFYQNFDLDFDNIDFSSSDFCEESNSSFTSKDILNFDDAKSEEIITKIPPKLKLPESLFNKKNTVCKRPWEEDLNWIKFEQKRLQHMTSYEENELFNKLKQLEEPLPPKYQRLVAKLRIRKLKRNKNLKLFNIDRVFDELGSNLKLTKESSHLDRYRSNQIILASGANNTQSDVPFHLKIIGLNNELKPCLSPYTNRILKPYIRRDAESTLALKPVWLKLMDELQKKCKVENMTEVSSIDYCYVRAEHIPAINMLCEIYFWPGIDMTESLKYPDFSCVALYKKIVLGFAFMIPDVSYNESYISLIFTRPEWRRAGIATFMLYHLVQTCMGKEVTLHVSATNPAVILYQKFGFKIEEFIQDFYEKYMTDGHECRHALFLRLAR